MLCPVCNTELRILCAATKITGDNSPATPTRVYTVHELTCRSPGCRNYERIVDRRELLTYEAQTAAAVSEGTVEQATGEPA